MLSENGFNTEYTCKVSRLKKNKHIHLKNAYFGHPSQWFRCSVVLVSELMYTALGFVLKFKRLKI